MIAGFPFIASSMDSDARAYCQASGATDRAALNYFVKGIKRLGLWEDMVCWPLRSAQNAGTGSTAYSLGGLGTYNGTLVNGPTWGTDGITFDGTNDLIEIIDGNNNAFAPQNTVFGAMAVSKTAASERQDVFNKAGPAESLPNLCWGVRDSDNTAQAFVSDGSTFGASSMAGTAVGVFRSTIFSYNQITMSARKNAEAAGTSSHSFNVQQIADQYVKIGAGTSTRYNGTIAFALFAVGLSADKQINLYNLYKSTLGQGVGLP